jgi:hypothetical protein
LLDELPDEKPHATLPETPRKKIHPRSTSPEATLQPQYKLGQQVWSQGFIAMTNGQVLGRDATCYITHIYDIRHIDFNIKGDHYQPKNIAYAIQATLADEPLLPRQLYAFEYELRAEQPPIQLWCKQFCHQKCNIKPNNVASFKLKTAQRLNRSGFKFILPETPATQEDTSSATYPRSNYPRRRSPATYPHH